MKRFDQSQNIYDPAFVRELFDEMGKTYGWVNLFSSFGFAHRWRRQCVAHLQLENGDLVCDMMSGQGESWSSIFEELGASGQLLAFDISGTMTRKSLQHHKAANVSHLSIQNALTTALADNSFDAVACTFGLKTMAQPQTEQLASELKRVLKPGGRFAFVEISRPPSLLLRAPYFFYLRYIIPLVGALFLGNPDTYRLLWHYTNRFENARKARAIFEEAGLSTNYEDLFYGCASMIYGSKPL